MKRLKLYLDTSVLNFAFAIDIPKEQNITLSLINEIKNGKHEAFVSEVVVREINRASTEKATKLKKLLIDINPIELSVDENSQILAEKYIEHGVIPPKYEDDALHIAVATVNDLDVIVSWNFTHIVKVKTKREVTGINLLMGYKEIEIYSPTEVVENV